LGREEGNEKLRKGGEASSYKRLGEGF